MGLFESIECMSDGNLANVFFPHCNDKYLTHIRRSLSVLVVAAQHTT